ncbi:MAG: 50S ribosomal protein L3 [Candidatus Brocadiia bacterium]
MVQSLIGRKVGMTQVFDDEGRRVPVTVLQVGPCRVVQVKTAETDQADAVQIGFDERKPKNVNRPMSGHFASAGVPPQQVLRDVAVEPEDAPEPGQELRVDVFEGASHVDVTGVSKGRGFAGVVRRHGFSGAPATHGGRFGRGPGSIGTSATPARVLKGKKMAGHMGAEQVTVRNLEVVKLDTEHDLMLVKGAVPGSKGNYVMVRKAVMPPGAKR